MNYIFIYNTIISKRQVHQYEGYTEKHHIIPMCLGGTNDKENLVALSAREHFIAHQLLSKIYPESRGLIYAAFKMSRYNKYGSKKYSWLKEAHSLKMKNRIVTPETRLKLKNRILPPVTQETKDKSSKSRTGLKRSKETKQKMSLNNHMKRLSPEQKEFYSNKIKGKNNPMYGKSFSEEHKTKLSAASKGRKCPNRKSRYTNPRWKFITPTNIELLVVNNIKQFCILHNLSLNRILTSINKGKITEVKGKFITELSKNCVNWEVVSLPQ